MIDSYKNKQLLIEVAKKNVKRISVPKSSMLKWTKLVSFNLLHSKKRVRVNEILDIYGGKENE